MVIEAKFFILFGLILIPFLIFCACYGYRMGRYLLSDKELWRMKRLLDQGINPFTGDEERQ